MRAKLVILGLFFVLGAFLVGTSLTGFVISQSCCFGEGCGEIDQCRIAELQEPRSTESPLIGVLVVLLSLGLAAGEVVYERRRQEKATEEKRSRKLRVV